jgi:parallel beta-helix repeat protein
MLRRDGPTFGRRRDLRTALLGCIAVVAFAMPATVARATTFTAIADSYVDASTPTANFGSSTTLRVDGSPIQTTYLKFDVSGLPSPSSAALRVFVTSDNADPFAVYEVANTSWSQSTITANNAPAVGGIIASSGPVTAGNAYTLDVSSAVTSNGLVSLALKTASSKSITLRSREFTGNRPELLVPAPASPSPFDVRRNGSTYTAESAGGTTYTGTAKFAVESAVADLNRAGGGEVRFAGSTTFDFGASHLELKDIVGVKFLGAGIDSTTLVNNESTATDTEVFDISRADGMVISGMTIRAGGPTRSTSDAIDFDSGNGSRVENVKVTQSRGRGIVFDGKDITGGVVRKAENNVISNCIVDGVPGDGIELLAASRNQVQGCTVTNTGGYGIQLVKGSPTAGQPNKKPILNVISANTVDQSGSDGINITSGDDNEVRGNTVTNSSDNVSGRDGIRITSSDAITCDDNVVSDNTATDNQATKTQRWGLRIVSTACHRTVVSNNTFTGNLTGEILDGGTDTQFGTPAPDTEAPTVPGGVTATAISSSRVDVAWSGSTDNVAVAGYTIYRGGTAIATVAASARSYQDTSVAPETTYTYTVDAFDAASPPNRSAQSAPASATTPAATPPPPTFTFMPVADSYVEELNPTTNRGTLTTLRIDGSPLVRSYLKFDVQGLPTGTPPTSAVLRVFANSSSSTGHEVRGLTDPPDNSWTETGITFANAPTFGGVVGTSGAFTSGQYIDVTVTPLVTGNGLLTFVLTGPGATAVSYASRETSANPPQLVVDTAP